MYISLSAQTNYRSITEVHASVYVCCSHFVTLHLPQFFSDSSTQLLAHVHIYVSKSIRLRNEARQSQRWLSYVLYNSE